MILPTKIQKDKSAKIIFDVAGKLKHLSEAYKDALKQADLQDLFPENINQIPKFVDLIEFESMQADWDFEDDEFGEYSESEVAALKRDVKQFTNYGGGSFFLDFQGYENYTSNVRHNFWILVKAQESRFIYYQTTKP